MDLLKQHWDRAVLAAVALAAIAVSLVFVMKSQAYPDTFTLTEVQPSDEIPGTEAGKVLAARTFLDTEVKWVRPVKGQEAPKPLPLFVSIPIVEVGGDLIDPNDPNAKQLRPPVSNAWLLKHELDFLDANVLEQDPDGDEFTNLEEWHAESDPRDPASHPPYTDRLFFVERKQQNYVLRFVAMPDEQRFQIQRLPTANWAAANFMLRVGETSEDNQFRVESVERKQGQNQLGIPTDMSELTITYLPTSEQVILTRGLDGIIPTYFAEFEFQMRGGSTLTVKKGDPFVLPVDPDTRYKLVDIQDDTAEISFEPEPGSEKILTIARKN